MKNIEVKILNPEQLKESEKMMVAMARLTQKGHTINNMHDLENLINRAYQDSTVEAMQALPHHTIKQFGSIHVAIVGASRRFLAQITRRRVGVTFMSASLQYSDYSESAKFVVPYEITRSDFEGDMFVKHGISNWYGSAYQESCEQALAEYEGAINQGIPHDAAAYMMPQGMRNVLVMSASPHALFEIIQQRSCKRNTLETQYVALKIWELLEEYPMFKHAGPVCMTSKCPEGKMFCGEVPNYDSAKDFLDCEFKYIRRTK